MIIATEAHFKVVVAPFSIFSIVNKGLWSDSVCCNSLHVVGT